MCTYFFSNLPSTSTGNTDEVSSEDRKEFETRSVMVQTHEKCIGLYVNK